MKRLLYHTLLCFAYNFMLLILPIFLFLLSLHGSFSKCLDTFLWLYAILLLASPIFSLILAYRAIAGERDVSRWISPFIVSFIGYIPLWLVSSNFSTCWGLREYGQVFLVPFAVGSLAALLHLVCTSQSRIHS